LVERDLTGEHALLCDTPRRPLVCPRRRHARPHTAALSRRSWAKPGAHDGRARTCGGRAHCAELEAELRRR
jgi:hypothetical protein